MMDSRKKERGARVTAKTKILQDRCTNDSIKFSIVESSFLEISYTKTYPSWHFQLFLKYIFFKKVNLREFCEISSCFS